MSPVTANSYLNAFSGLMKYAEDEHFIERSSAKGLRLASDGIRAKDRRLPFSIEDLRAIFSAPLFTGCLNDERGYSVPGPNLPRRSRFWVPLISLFTGMRLNEICQLSCNDIGVFQTINTIRIRSDPEQKKRVKTASGERTIPIHPELIRMGFLDYVSEIRTTGSTRLFPDLAMASTGYYSDNFSKWFRHFLRSVGITHPREKFHSFRHNFTDALREADISLEKVRAIQGWTTHGMEGVYGGGQMVKSLATDIEKISYHDLDLSHLHKKNTPVSPPCGQ